MLSEGDFIYVPFHVAPAPHPTPEEKARLEQLAPQYGILLG